MSENDMKTHVDVKATVESKKWFYNEVVREHFFNPKNLLKSEEEAEEYSKEASGIGQVGSPACGDMMKMWIKVDSETETIVECKWQTFGCASAIGSTSMLSVMLTENKGMKVEEALKIKPQDIANRLKGLPQRKFHCSVLGDKALRYAVNDYFRKSGQSDRVIVDGAKIIDKIADYDVFGYELHHNRKKDSPSGTAKSIEKILLDNIKRKKKILEDKLDRKINADELHFASIRGGDIPGTHVVGFDSVADTIELKHTARSREGFALGAIMAAQWLKGKKGFFTIDDMMNEIIR